MTRLQINRPGPRTCGGGFPSSAFDAGAWCSGGHSTKGDRDGISNH